MYTFISFVFIKKDKGLIWVFLAISGKGVSGYFITEGFIEIQEYSDLKSSRLYFIKFTNTSYSYLRIVCMVYCSTDTCI